MPNNQTKVSVKVSPNAGKNEVIGLNKGVWRIKIAAPPDKGKANKELIKFVSDILGLKKDAVMILKGQTRHNKLIAIDGLNQEEIILRLSAAK